jgi:stage II sporulation protein D
VQGVLKVRRRRVLAVLGAVVGAALTVASCTTGPVNIGLPTATVHTRPVVLRVQVREGSALVVREVTLEDYVATTALSEVHPDVADAAVAERMYEVQAVIARTYAMTNRGRHAKDGFDLCSTTHCQLYEPARLSTSRWALASRDATQRTAGEVLWYADAAARALFHADCGGRTSSASAVWGRPGPIYLVGEKDDGPAANAHSEWIFETTVAALRTALNSDPRTEVGAKLEAVEVAARDESGRAEKILLRGTRTFVVRGEVFREVVTRRLGAKTVKSTLFSVKKGKNGFSFVGRGFGHGVGLCQAGALARLRAGDSPEDVLAHYFPGTSLHH